MNIQTNYRQMWAAAVGVYGRRGAADYNAAELTEGTGVRHHVRAFTEEFRGEVFTHYGIFTDADEPMRRGNTFAVRTYSAIYDNRDSIRGTHVHTVAEFRTAGEAWECLTTEYPDEYQSFDFNAGCVVFRDGDRDHATAFHFPTVDVLPKPVDPWGSDGIPF